MTLALPFRGASGADVRPGKQTSAKLADKLRARRLAELVDEKNARRAENLARTCPLCGCTPDGRRCAIVLDGGGVGECVPSGTCGLEVCSACAPREAAR